MRGILSVCLWGVCFAASAPTAEPPGPGVALSNSLAYGVVANGKAFDADDFTVAAWVKPRSLAGSQVLVSRGAANEQFTLYFYSERVRMLVQHQPGKYTHANVPLPALGVWTHYAGTYNGREIMLFVNGKLEATAPAAGRMPKSDTPLYMGVLQPGERGLDGSLEDVRFYRRALAEQEIPALLAEPAQADLDLVGRWTGGSLGDQKKSDPPGSGAEATWNNLAQADLPAEFVTGRFPPATKDDGYRGIWYSNQKQDDEYV